MLGHEGLCQTYRNTEDIIVPSLVLDCIVNDSVLIDLLLRLSLSQIRHTVVRLPEVDLGETAIEQDLRREELEVEAQLFVVTVRVLGMSSSTLKPGRITYIV